MGKKPIIFTIFFLLGLSLVYAAPINVYTTSLDADTVYGQNDPSINIITAWNKNNYTVTGNFSCVDTTSPPESLNVTDNGDRTYTLAYAIITPPADQNCTIPITAIDPTDNSTTTDYSFFITIDSTLPNVTNLVYLPAVIFNVTDVLINATITDGNIKNIFASGDWENFWKNYSISNFNNPFYEIDSGYLDGGETINFGFYAADLANNTGFSLSSFYVTKKTLLTVIPNQPDGLNGWYVTTPYFILTPDTGRTAFYRWDSLSEYPYTGPFNYSEAPGGIEDLNYWSNDTGNNRELEQEYLLKLDTNAPLAINLKPANNSNVSSAKPNIYAYLDEIYQANSGVDKSSVIMFLDEGPVSPTISAADTLDAEINYTPETDLPEGRHNVSIFAKDNAGNNMTAAWSFNVAVVIPEEFSWNISSPANGSYSFKKIMFNISASKKAKIRYSLDRDKSTTICTWCSHYEREKYFREGPHNLTINATDIEGNVLTRDFFVEIDSELPRIMRTSPKANIYLKGTNFSVKYNEMNLKDTTLQLDKINASEAVNISKSCDSGRNQECAIEVNLSDYNGILEYTFFLKDNFNTTSSAPIRVNIDNLAPVITINSPEGIYDYPRGILFNITLDSRVKSLEYSEGARKGVLCSKCETYSRVRYFSSGNHTLNITATDFAGNTASESVSFGVS